MNDETHRAMSVFNYNLSYVHKNPDVFEIAYFFFLHQSTFRPHETSESAHRNHFFLKPLSTVVGPVHTNTGKYKHLPRLLSGLKTSRLIYWLETTYDVNC